MADLRGQWDWVINNGRPKGGKGAMGLGTVTWQVTYIYNLSLAMTTWLPHPSPHILNLMLAA